MKIAIALASRLESAAGLAGERAGIAGFGMILILATLRRGAVERLDGLWCLAAVGLWALAGGGARRLGDSGGARAVGPRLALGALGALALAQCVPLPLDWVETLSPQRAWIERAVFAQGASGADAGATSPRLVPLSLVPAETLFEAMRLAAALAVIGVLGGHSRRLGAAAAAAPLAAAAALQGGLGLLQHLDRHPSLAAAGSYVNRNHFAGLLALALPLCAGWALVCLARAWRSGGRGRAAWEPVLAAAATALALGGLLTSYSRGGTLSALGGAAAAGALAWLGLRRQGREHAAQPRRISTPTRLAIALALLGLLAGAVALTPPALKARFLQLTDGGVIEAASRPRLWRESLDLIADYPWVGCGLGAYESAFQRYKRDDPRYRDDYAHNDYLQLLAETGPAGLALALGAAAGVLLIGVRGALRARSPEEALTASGAVGALVAVGLHGLVDFNLYIPANGLAAAWAAGVALNAGAGAKAATPSGR